MKALSTLTNDTRLASQSDFVQKVLSLQNLTDTQVNELEYAQNIQIKHESITAVSNFLKTAKKLMICGDYDADGVSSTAIAYMLASKLGVSQIGYYIPNRFTEGYGVTMHTVKLAYEKGYTDLLIVDTGVKAHEAVTYALSLKMNVAIVDHHLIEGALPNCTVLHPDFLGEYGSTMCASGLMFLVAEELNLLDPKITAYAALGTVADIMPMWHKNREIVRRGLEALNTHKILNLDVLWNRYGNTAYESKTLGFQVIPKINTIGRMADRVNMNTMVRYLLSNDADEIRTYASQVLEINNQRKAVSQSTYEQAKLLQTDAAMQIISDANFHEGILGIVANQIMNETNKPTLILKEKDDMYKGSARSSTVSLQELFSKLDPDYFLGFGGHAFAFGLSVKKDMYEDFCIDVQKIVQGLDEIVDDKTVIYCDVPIRPQMMQELKALDPFGPGFEMPSFKVDGFVIKDVQMLGTYGFKLVFDDFWLKDAVVFNNSLDPEILKNVKDMTGTFDVHPRFGLSFSIEDFSI